jgi:hypothetical protein
LAKSEGWRSRRCHQTVGDKRGGNADAVADDTARWRIWPYTGALVAALIIIAAIPWLSIGFLH